MGIIIVSIIILYIFVARIFTVKEATENENENTRKANEKKNPAWNWTENAFDIFQKMKFTKRGWIVRFYFLCKVLLSPVAGW